MGANGLRIIAGIARGRTLETLPGLHTRPTSDRVKESLFSMLQMRLRDARVLDLFAGSGALGLEALSRGAAYAVFVDEHRPCVQTVEKNIQRTGFDAAMCRVLHAPASQAMTRLQSSPPFDIVFVDPPYRLGVYERVLQALFHGGLVAEDGLVVCEHAAQNAILEQPDIYRAVDTRRYGKSALTFIQGVGRAAAKRGLHDEDMHLSGEL